MTGQRAWIADRATTCDAQYRAERPGQQAGAVFRLCMAKTATARMVALDDGRWRAGRRGR